MKKTAFWIFKDRRRKKEEKTVWQFFPFINFISIFFLLSRSYFLHSFFYFFLQFFLCFLIFFLLFSLFLSEVFYCLWIFFSSFLGASEISYYTCAKCEGSFLMWRKIITNEEKILHYKIKLMKSKNNFRSGLLWVQILGIKIILT